MASIDEFLRRPRRSEAELERDLAEVRAEGVQMDGQHASDEMIRQHRESVMRGEAVAFADVLRRELPEADSDSDEVRQAAHVAATLLYLNLRSSFPDSQGGPVVCDEVARQAAEWFAGQGGATLPVRGELPVQEGVLMDGAAFAQRIIEKFPRLVADLGIDLRQACFAAALLTVRMRAGEVNLFAPAARAATEYFNVNLEKA